jgi:calcineurin-like phosphoesterase
LLPAHPSGGKMRVLFFGDLVGEMAIRYLEGNLARLR